MKKEVFFSINSNEATRLSRLCRQQKLKRIYQGIYTDNLELPLDTIVQRNGMPIVAYLISKGILGFRSAMEVKLIPFEKDVSIVFVISTYSKTITLPGLIIKVLKGNPEECIEQVIPNLSRSKEPRFLLENLSSVRGARYKGIKTVGEEAVEAYLVKVLQERSESALNAIRDEAKPVAEKLGYHSEFKKINLIISTLLSTHPSETLKTPHATSIVEKKPYDLERLNWFEQLKDYLNQCRFDKRNYSFSVASFRYLSFFESYFSNFIEGTEFIINEAEKIVFSGSEINNRHADSHDILALFRLCSDFSEMQKVLRTPEDFLNVLQERHVYLMKERLDKRPGEFKNRLNKAGNTCFVKPEEVIGTLCRSFEIYQSLCDGMSKALFMHFLISEVHPFDDGNGRIARLMMNMEFVETGLYKMIIPTAHRDNYLNGLRIASRDQEFRTYCRVMDQAQAYTASIDWTDYGEVRSKLEKDHADKIPDEGLPIFNRALRELRLSKLAPC